jgi:hypothetical protein
MRLRDVQARFTDPLTGQVIRIDGQPQEFAAIVLAALDSGLRLTHLSEHAPDAAFAGWPLLLLLRLARGVADRCQAPIRHIRITA